MTDPRPPEGPDREALDEYLDSMDKSGGGIYTADFRDGFRHALAMLTAQVSGDEREPVREATREALARQAALLPTPPAPGGEGTDLRAAVDALKYARRKMSATLVAVAPHLDKPYSNDPRTPWEHMVVPADTLLRAAVDGVVAALAARDTDREAGDQLRANLAATDDWLRTVDADYKARIEGLRTVLDETVTALDQVITQAERWQNDGKPMVTPRAASQRAKDALRTSDPVRNYPPAALAARDTDQGAGALAEAWQEGYNAAETMARCWGHTDWWEGEPENPYRAALARATPEAGEGT
jgi:hypothetical protein